MGVWLCQNPVRIRHCHRRKSRQWSRTWQNYLIFFFFFGIRANLNMLKVLMAPVWEKRENGDKSSLWSWSRFSCMILYFTNVHNENIVLTVAVFSSHLFKRSQLMLFCCCIFCCHNVVYFTRIWLPTCETFCHSLLVAGPLFSVK